MKYVALVVLAIMAGCGSTMTLEEMEEAEKVAATAEEREDLQERIDTFYANWDKATLYFENRKVCDNTQGYQYFCDNVKAYKQDVSRLTPDALVRVWKREYQSCGCVTDAQMDYIMKDIRRQMRTF